MKTKTIFSVLSLALILSAVTSAFSANVETKKDPASTTPVIRYQVNVILESEKPLCNLWLVKIIDGNGRQVAPAKPYSTSVSRYDFYERGPVEGIRIAVLVKYTYGDHFVCETELFTAPAMLSGKFLNGQTYRFDLFPSLQAPRP